MPTMKHEGDVFSLSGVATHLVFTANSVVNSHGRLVMGAGIALQFRNAFKDLDLDLGQQIQSGIWTERDCVGYPKFFLMQSRTYPQVLALQTKTDWRQPSDPLLIQRGLSMLNEFCRDEVSRRIAMPIPGCGNGGLDPNNILPMADEILSYAVAICHPNIRQMCWAAGITEGVRV